MRGSVQAGCSGALNELGSRRPEDLDWAGVEALLTEAEADSELTAVRPQRSAFERFALRVGKLGWSSRSNRRVVRRALVAGRRYLSRSPSDLCAHVRAFAASGIAPRATREFAAAAEREANDTGLFEFDSVLSETARGPDRHRLRLARDAAIRYLERSGRLAETTNQRIVEIVGLGPLRKVLEDDGRAKSNARNLVSEVESCFTEFEDYRKCRTPENTGLPIGSGAGQVEVTDAGQDTWTIVGRSVSGTDFTIAKDETGRVARTCSRGGVGGCLRDDTW